MYNESQKTKFLDSGVVAPGSRNLAISLFSSCEKYEVQWGADICTRTKEELQPVMNMIFGMKVQSIGSRYSILQRYARWCIDTGVPGARSDIFDVKPNLVDIVAIRTVPNPIALQRALNLVFAPEEQQTTDNVNRLFFWLAFSGIMLQESYNVTSDEVDLINGLINHKGKTFQIYREAIPALLNCINLEEFRVIGRVRQVIRVKGNNLLRTSSERDMAAKFPRSVLYESSCKLSEASARNDTIPRISYDRVWVSGVFYREYEREMAGFPVSFRDVVKYQMESTKYSERMMIPTNQSSIKSKLLKGYREDYENWKRAFYNK